MLPALLDAAQADTGCEMWQKENEEIMDNVQKKLLKQIAGLHEIPVGAYNIRTNGKTRGKERHQNISKLSPKEGSDGIVIKIKAGTKNESIHIPVVLSEAGLKETVYNDFYMGMTVMLRLLQAAVFTAEQMIPVSMMEFTAFLSVKIQR